MTVDAYTPVACDFHERLEFAVLRRLMLELRWVEQAEIRAARVLPLDVATRDGAEWLTYRVEHGPVGVIRLDRITAMRELPGR